MSLGLLPWEKWLPPYVFGPVVSIASGAVLFTAPSLAWWQTLLLASGTLYGAWGTWYRFKYRRNAFDTAATTTEPKVGKRP